MCPITLRIRRKAGTEDLPLPRYMSGHAAGMDLAAAVDSPRRLQPGEIVAIPTGLFLEIPPGYEAQIRPRSGLARKHGLSIPNAPGTIDADYRGELQVLLINLGREPVQITRGMRIAQMVIAPVVRVEVKEVTELGDTARGTGGFGHTGH